jgi:adenylate kinase
MNLVLLGPPGAGKGTQSRVLSERLGIPVISTGEMLRDAARRGTEFGKKAKEFTDQGLLVPDALIIPLVQDRLMDADCAGGALFDGFPRTVEQAEALDRLLAEHGLGLDAVVHLVVDREELVSRLSGRRVCSRCEENYHIVSRPPKKPGVCDLDGAPLIQRDDDRPEPIRRRLDISDRATAPVVEFYRQKGLLSVIDGSRPTDEVTRAIEAVLSAATNGAGRAGGTLPRPSGPTTIGLAAGAPIDETPANLPPRPR